MIFRTLFTPWRTFVTFVLLYLVLHSVFVLGKMFPSTEGETGYHSKFNLGFHHKLPDYLFEMRAYIEPKKELSNIFLFPPCRSNIYEWGYAGAGDITLNLFNRGLLFQQYGEGFAPPNNLDALYQLSCKAIMTDNPILISNLFQLLNSNFLLQRNDFVYNFFGENEYSPDKIRSVLSNTCFKLKKSFGKWDLYETKAPFLPVLYTARNLYVTELNQLSHILSSTDYSAPSVFFFSRAERDKIKKLPDVITPPVLEFKRINPAKYRLRLHNIRGSFPLVFNQTFHSGWRLYKVPHPNFQISNAEELLSKFKPLAENEESSANVNELRQYIKDEKISSLGNGERKLSYAIKWKDWREIKVPQENYDIDFISKENYGVIQNDNLPNGKFYETWFLKRSPYNHVQANAYANGWIIEEENQNKAEFILEFFPLTLFYLGVSITSVLILILSGLFLKLHFRK